jgi:hypothetical protein
VTSLEATSDAAHAPPGSMPTHALRTSDLQIARFADVLVLLLALPVFLAAELPLLGWGGVAGGWLLQRAAQAALARRAKASDDPRTAVGLLSVSLIGRVWFLALVVLGVGLIDRDAGLPAAVLAVVVFQVQFTLTLVSGGLGRRA